MFRLGLIAYALSNISFLVSTENCLVPGLGLNRFSEHYSVPG
jgi:hypothetical protein